MKKFVVHVELLREDGTVPFEEERFTFEAENQREASAWFNQVLSAVQFILYGGGRRKRQRYATNPQLVIYNPPVRFRGPRQQVGGRVKGVISEDVHQVWYTHFEDKKAYRHPFEGDVIMIAMQQPDGQRDIHLTHKRGLPLWEDFDR